MKSSSLFDPLFLPLGLGLLAFLAPRVSVSATIQPTCYWEYENLEAPASNDGPCAIVNSTSVSTCPLAENKTVLANTVLGTSLVL